ncbi:MAG: hypothetical protein ACXAEU_07160 [Candidatus Hodarchaeales archaeon]
MDYLPQVEGILKKLLKADRMVKGVVLSDKTGLSLMGVWRTTMKNMELEGTASLASAMYSAGENFGGGSLGELDVIALDYKKSKIRIFLIGAGRAVIAMVTGLQADTKGVKSALRRYSEDIEKLMIPAVGLDIMGRRTESMIVEKEPSIASKMADALKELESF